MRAHHGRLLMRVLLLMRVRDLLRAGRATAALWILRWRIVDTMMPTRLIDANEGLRLRHETRRPPFLVGRCVIITVEALC